MAEIRNRFTNEIICEDKNKSIRELALENLTNLSGADLSDADLSHADLRYVNLRYADLSHADLSHANLRYVNLRYVNLRYADLRYANLRYANLRYVNLRYVNLRYADLRYADLSHADLSHADLSHADLRYANLSGANLSGAIGLKNAADFLDQFEQDELGILVYKRIGNGQTQYAPPSTWKVKKGAILTENPNPTRTQECGCGVNFGTLEYCKQNYTNADLWLCRIAWIDLADVIVPYHTNGKARCAKLTLIKKVKI